MATFKEAAISLVLLTNPMTMGLIPHVWGREKRESEEQRKKQSEEEKHNTEKALLKSKLEEEQQARELAEQRWKDQVAVNEDLKKTVKRLEDKIDKLLEKLGVQTHVEQHTTKIVMYNNRGDG